jgi:TnpA family transposase
VVHRIGVRAERKVVKILLQDFRKVHGKTALLYRLAEAATEQPDGVVREVLFPVVGEKTLFELVREYRATGPAFQQQVHTVLRSSYGNHYRRMLPLLLDALAFRSNNIQHRPVIDALEVLRDLRDSKRAYLAIDEVPMDGVVRPSQEELVIEEAADGGLRVNRINYEICVLQALRERLRCKEIWVVGAHRFRNPDEDLPGDFEAKREAYYQALAQPTDADAFVEGVKRQLALALTMLDRGLPNNKQVRLVGKDKRRLSVSPLEPLPEPRALNDVKGEVFRRWHMTNLLDVIKEADLRVDVTGAFETLGHDERLSREVLQRRLLLCLFALGTNTGLARVSSGDTSVSYRELLYVRRRFITKVSLREAISRVVNATLAARQPEIWGEGTTACAGDAKKFGAWDQNLMTEWHIRYGGRGVMIYWTLDTNACCIYSQLKRCSSSEVAAMIEGVLRHCTEMTVDKSYVDSHGQSEVAFAFCHLLGFDLLPRLKNLATQKLYQPEARLAAAYPNLQSILTRPIKWELICRQYDEIIKFATALRLGTAEAEAILRRFSRGNLKHPTYQALAELGKALKTSFLCHYLSSEALRREIHEGLQVIETWNSVNGFLFYGKGGEVATNRLEDQEISVLALHLLQACLVYINTLMLQNVLADETWLSRMTPEDLRGLSPLIYSHVNPYGSFELHMSKRLDLCREQLISAEFSGKWSLVVRRKRAWRKLRQDDSKLVFGKVTAQEA